ncbi:MAG: hypothetical protein CMI53_04630 [Parcubacteria group bacterium]|nr:hypothetical protein [Parcubacteria group bacterium]|tara:strand:+ start:2351 stop:3064 length:714 start_codon:yes stop_codon:yes gene_type:complete
MQIIVLDTETTNLDDKARLVQLAYKNMNTGEEVDQYFKPPVPISFGAMATHHITEEMIADKPQFDGSDQQSKIISLLEDNILVAHNALFDINILRNEGVRTHQYIDTLRLSMHLLDTEQYKLQFLRYALGLKVKGTAHNALGDIAVLELLFNHLINEAKEKFSLSSDEEIFGKMIELTKTPVLLKKFAFGKHAGKTFEQVNETDQGYLKWLYESESKKPQLKQSEELVYTLKKYLNL